MFRSAGLVVCTTVLILSHRATVRADIIQVVNAGFEDTSGQTVFNEFTFGTPNGWSLYDPDGIIGTGFYPGTLQPNGTDFFDTLAPEGTRVGILFNSQRQGDGEYGFSQTLDATLQSNSRYQLSVQVGNIGSGNATNGDFFDLSGFPGYRVDLLAGDTVIAQDNNLLTIPERQWDTSIVEFTTGNTHALLGENLGIRVVNLNAIPDGYTIFDAPDSEVDFDAIQLTVTAVPEANGFIAMLIVIAACVILGIRFPLN